MMTVGLNKLDLKKLKKSHTQGELTTRLQDYKRAEARLKAECQKKGIQGPVVIA